jgi:hypothetical protein
MGQFLTTLKTEQKGKWKHKLFGVLEYHDEKEGLVEVPEGFETDFASIKVLHNVFLFVLFALVSGYGNYSATVHDFLYATSALTRRRCDDVLYRALRAEGIAQWRAWLFWAGVRLGGGRAWEKHKSMSQAG